MLFSSCKSKESAYRQAYEKAKAQETVVQDATPVQVTPVQPVQQQQQAVSTMEPTEQEADTRTIQGGLSVVNGDPLDTYSVVVGSFVTQANAEGLMQTLRGKGYGARVVKTNETINGHTGWFRVVASSFAGKQQAVTSRDELRGAYPGAWILKR